MDYAIIMIASIIGAFFVGYYKGKVDATPEAYQMGETAGWMQAMRRQR